MLAQIVKALAQKSETTITEEKEEQSVPLLEAGDDDGESDSQNPAEQVNERTQESLEARLERAYQELLSEGERISGRALAKRAHAHRLTCNQWLREREMVLGDEEQNGVRPEEDAGSDIPDVT